MENRLDVGMLLNLNAETLRAHARRGAGRVGHIDGVDAQLRQDARALDLLPAIDSARGNDLDQRNEAALGHQRAEVGARAQRLRRRFGVQFRRGAGDFDAGLRVNGAHGRAHGANVVGRGAAAAAHELHSRLDGLAGKAGHVLRRAEVDIATLDGARHAGVGHGGQRQRGGRAHGFNGGEHRGRSGGAVDPDGVRAPLGEQRGGQRGGCAVQAVALLVHRHHHQHGQKGSDLAGGVERFAGLVQRGHGLDDQQVNAFHGQGADLLGKGGASLVQAGLAQRLQAHPQRTNRAGHKRGSGLLVFEVFDGLPGQLYPGDVDFGDFIRQPMAGQPEAVGAKGVGLDDLRAGLQVFFVNRQDQARVGEVQLVVAAVDEDAAGVERSAHGAVNEHGAVGEDVGKLRHSIVMLSHAGLARQSIFNSTAQRGSLPVQLARAASEWQVAEEAGQFCYTSIVITLGCGGLRTACFLRSAGFAGNPGQSVHAAALVAGKLRGLLRVYSRGMGF